MLIYSLWIRYPFGAGLFFNFSKLTPFAVTLFIIFSLFISFQIFFQASPPGLAWNRVEMYSRHKNSSLTGLTTVQRFWIPRRAFPPNIEDCFSYFFHPFSSFFILFHPFSRVPWVSAIQLWRGTYLNCIFLLSSSLFFGRRQRQRQIYVCWLSGMHFWENLPWE